MNRRGVLKFLGLSSVAAPALAKSGVDTGLSAARLAMKPRHPSGRPVRRQERRESKHWAPGPPDTYRVERLNHPRRDLAGGFGIWVQREEIEG